MMLALLRQHSNKMSSKSLMIRSSPKSQRAAGMVRRAGFVSLHYTAAKLERGTSHAL
jgi:hypothetical protein